MLVSLLVRTVSASGVIVGGFSMPGSILGMGGGIDGVSSTFDNTGVAGQYVGLSFNGGASASITVTSVNAELVG
jgi:hypothetical protein